VDLRGWSSQPATAHQVAGRILREVGYPDDMIPADEDERRALYRSALVDRQLLIVLDDARDGTQVRPLLPSNSGSAALITSRRRITGLAGATLVELDGFDEEEAHELFTSIIGRDRATGEPRAVSAILTACGHLPLAVRVAGSRLATRPNWRVQTLADRLALATDRLDELSAGDQQTRATFESSYQALSDEQARAFRLLALAEVEELTTSAAGALLDRNPRGADRIAESLADVNLLDPVAPGRYRYHELLRLFAREKALQVEDARDRAKALTRLIAMYHDTVLAATQTLRPGYRPADVSRSRFAGLTEARNWLDQEYCNLTAMIIQGSRGTVTDLQMVAQTLEHVHWFLRSRGHWDAWDGAAQAILAAADTKGLPRIELIARQHLGQLALLRGDSMKARDELNRALTLARVSKDRAAEAYTLNRLGLVDHQRNAFEAAIDHHEQARLVFSELGDRRGIWTSLTNLGKCHRELHQPEQAVQTLAAAQQLAHDLADPECETMVLHHLACCQADLGDYDAAVAAHLECLALTRQLGQREGEAYTIAELGRTHLKAGHLAEAIDYLHQAVTHFRTLGDANSTATFLADLGHAYAQGGNRAAAESAWRQALAYFQTHDQAIASSLRKALGQVDTFSDPGLSPAA
jgi:tetratricopeptide (TPR) repeat protein